VNLKTFKMKKILLSIIYTFACIFSTQAQALYGITPNGVSSGAGKIIKFTPATNNLVVAKSFESIADEGSYPIGSLVEATDGKLYAMSNVGGSSSVGVIFSFDPSSSTYTKLIDFNVSNGANPNGSLIQASDGKLFGMTQLGGSSNAGVIFSFDPSSSTYTKLKDFDYTDGATPYGSLVQASDGKLYGMTPYTYQGRFGPDGNGVIFSFDPSSSTYTKLHDFEYLNGINPIGSLMQASDGKLYGMTGGGGINDAGVIFSFDPSSSTYTKLNDFDGTNGLFPTGNLTQASDGKLYGMTVYGGSSNAGVIFSFDLSSSTYTKLKDFGGADGEHGFGSLLQASDGKLYGMTANGGSNIVGVIFSFDPSSNAFAKLQDFNYTNGANPAYGSAFIEVDECVSGTTYYKDADADGYGDPTNSVVDCSQPAGYVTNNSDCNDSPSTGGTVHPGATELCNGIDDNCDGSVDEGFADTDGDHLADCVDPDDDNDGVPDFKDCEPLNNKKNNFLICHMGKTLCVGEPAVAAHLKHGDTEGGCGSNLTTLVSRPDNNVITEFKLSNYPNPFAGSSTIKFELPFDSKVSIKVYDLLGRIVTTLVDGDKKAGSYTIDFKTNDLNKRAVYYRMIATSKETQFSQTNRMTQVR
jgi:uncharacterized repeat protein (TIGR03803 family)